MDRRRIQQILTGLGLPYKDQKKAVNVNCPFCVGSTHRRRDDQSRCGIFSNLRFHCWRCKRTGSLYKLLHAATGLLPEEYRLIVGEAPKAKEGETTAQQVRKLLAGDVDGESPRVCPREVPLPPSRAISAEMLAEEPDLRDFLRERRLTLDTCEEYGARYTGPVGRFACRLVLPFLGDGGEVYAWQGRDMTGRSKKKYLTEGDISQLLYWSSFLRNPRRVYLVEGVFDCWRMEYNAVASMTCSLSRPQRRQLLEMELIDELVICWDPDAYRKAREIARDLAAIMDKVGVVRVPEGTDPDAAGAEAIRELPVEWM